MRRWKRPIRNVVSVSIMPNIGKLFPTCSLEIFSERSAWLEGRRQSIGASDAAAILGEGYADQSPITIYADKRGEILADADAEPDRLRIGRMIEPTLRKIFRAKTRKNCYAVPAFSILRNRALPWLSASLDGYAIDSDLGPCPVELKNVSGFNWREWRDDDRPLKFEIQCNHQMLVTGARAVFLFGLIAYSTPIVKVIERNQRFIDALLRQLERFWNYCQRGECPPVDDSLATGRVLAAIYPEAGDAEPITLPDAAADWDRDLQSAKLAEAEAKRKRLALENRFKAAIGSATLGILPDGGRYQWKTYHRDGYTVGPQDVRALHRLKR